MLPKSKPQARFNSSQCEIDRLKDRLAHIKSICAEISRTLQHIERVDAQLSALSCIACKNLIEVNARNRCFMHY